MSEKIIVPQNKDVLIVRVNSLPIELYKILKIENLAQSGGEAKFVIAKGLVSVNGEVETRKGKKIFSGDIVSFNNKNMRIYTNEQLDNDEH